MPALVEQASANDTAGGKHDPQRYQHIGPVELDGAVICIRERSQRLNGCAFKDCHIAGLVQSNPADRAGVIRGNCIAGDIAAGGRTSVSGYRREAIPQSIAVCGGGVVSLPVNALKRQGTVEEERRMVIGLSKRGGSIPEDVMCMICKSYLVKQRSSV